MSSTLQELWREEDAVEVIEIILILVVLIALVATFKKQLNSLISTLLKNVTTDATAI